MSILWLQPGQAAPLEMRGGSGATLTITQLIIFLVCFHNYSRGQVDPHFNELPKTWQLFVTGEIICVVCFRSHLPPPLHAPFCANAASSEMLVNLTSICYCTLWLLPSLPVHWFHSLCILILTDYN